VPCGLADTLTEGEDSDFGWRDSSNDFGQELLKRTAYKVLDPSRIFPDIVVRDQSMKSFFACHDLLARCECDFEMRGGGTKIHIRADFAGSMLARTY